jgi:hypothetical protein
MWGEESARIVLVRRRKAGRRLKRYIVDVVICLAEGERDDGRDCLFL